MTVLQTIWAFIVAHQVIATLIIVQGILALPMPDATSNAFYRWFFAFASSIPSVLRAGASMGKTGQKAPALIPGQRYTPNKP